MSSTLRNPQAALRDLLDGAPRCSREVLAEMAALGFSAKQVRSAREKLRLVTTRTGSGDSMRTTWGLLPGEAIRAHADRSCTPAPAREPETSEGQQGPASAPPDSGTAGAAACSEMLRSPPAVAPTDQTVRNAAVRSQVRSGEGVMPAPPSEQGPGDGGRVLTNADAAPVVSTVVSTASAAQAQGVSTADEAGTTPAAAPSPAVATVPPQVAEAPAELPRGPGFGDSLKRGQNVDTMDEAALRAYARTIGISPRDCTGLTVERLRQNCTAHLYELIDAL